MPIIALVWNNVTKRGVEDEQEQSLKSHSERGFYWPCQNGKLEASSCQVEWGVERKTSHSLPRCQALCKPPLHRCQLWAGILPVTQLWFCKATKGSAVFKGLLKRAKGCKSTCTELASGAGSLERGYLTEMSSGAITLQLRLLLFLWCSCLL